MGNAINSVDLSGYTPDDRAVLERALEVMESLRWDVPEIERVTQRKWTTVTRFMQGKPQGDAAGVIADIARLNTLDMRTSLIETPIVRDYLRVLRNVRAFGTMGVIVARNGRGKSLTASTFRRRCMNVPGETPIMVQCPSRCTRDDLVRLLLGQLNANADDMSQPERERELMRLLTPRHMLIIDEAGYLVRPNRRTSPLRLLQDLHDNNSCGIAMIMRPSQWNMLFAGRNAQEDEQFLGRILHRSILTGDNASYKRDEIEAIVRAFHPDVTTELRESVRTQLRAEAGGIRALVYDLSEAAKFAADAGKQFADAFAQVTALRDKSEHILQMPAF